MSIGESVFFLLYIYFVGLLCLLCFARYRISGSALLAAMDQSSHIPSPDALSVSSGEVSSHGGIREHMDSLHCQGKSDTLSKMVDKCVVPPTVDVAEILRRWTHALQRIHKHSLHLVSLFILSKRCGNIDLLDIL